MKKKRKISLRERLGYLFDNIMSKGTVSLVAILFAITALVVVVAGILVVLFDKSSAATVGGGIWVSLMHAIDSGTLTADSGSGLFMLLMTLVTICGLFITSVLIGIINTGIETKMVSLSKGKSCVLVEGHTVILGFNRNTFTILSKLIEANANQEKSVVVVMDNNRTMVEMEDLIHQKLPNTGNTKIICRCGSITDLADVAICAPEYARSVLINSEDDFASIKAILTVTTLLKQAGNRSTYLTAVIRSRENYDAARMAGEGQAEILFFEDTIAKILAHTSRQPGYSSIYTEFFSFSGNEIYVESIPGLTGMTMDTLNRFFPVSTILGLEKNGKILINPPADTKVEDGDRMILIAEDDRISVPSPLPAPIDEDQIQKTPDNSPEKIQKILLLGYSPRIGLILEEQDCYMAPGSCLLIAVQREFEAETRAMIRENYQNIQVQLLVDDIYRKSILGRILDWKPDSVLVASSMMADPQEDDNKTLFLLLQLRTLAKERKLHYTITSEMREVENQEVAQITEVRDFVISSNITSMMLTQISQSRKLNRIFSVLLSAEGSEIYMRPAGDYVTLGVPVSIYTACAAAQWKHQIFIGFRRTEPDTGKYEVYTNPPKATQVTFREDDCFIVIAEN